MKDYQVISPAPRPVWNELFHADPQALAEQSPAWVDCICADGSYQDASRLYELGDGRRLLMPMVRRKGLPAALASEASFPPAWGMGGLLASEPLTPANVALVFDDLQQRTNLSTRIRPNPLEGEIWAAAQPAGVIALSHCAHVLDLAGGFEQVWMKRFESRTRNKVRKAEKANLTVECDTTGRLIPAFYTLFEKSLERWSQHQNEPACLAHWRGQRRDPMHKFEQMAKSLGDAFRLWLASVDGQPAAAILVLQGVNAHYTRGAMDVELAGPTNANFLLHRLAIEDACKAGCHFYHMGETGSSSSLAQFKGSFGAEAYPYAEYHVERLPFTRIDQKVRGLVKRFIGFKDA